MGVVGGGQGKEGILLLTSLARRYVVIEGIVSPYHARTRRHATWRRAILASLPQALMLRMRCFGAMVTSYDEERYATYTLLSLFRAPR